VFADPGFGAALCFIDPCIRDPGLTSRIIFPRAKKQFIGLKILEFFDADPDPRSFDPGSGIKDGKFRSGINIPDSQHCQPSVTNIRIRNYKTIIIKPNNWYRWCVGLGYLKDSEL
jgi:hypothetical protein